MHIKRNFRLLDQAKELRKNMTSQENKLWYEFLKLYPVRIYRQRIIDSFIADFYCASAKLVIEIDGSQHFTLQGKAYDEERERIMQQYGIKTIRFSNFDIDFGFQNVCTCIHEEIQNRIKEKLPE